MSLEEHIEITELARSNYIRCLELLKLDDRDVALLHFLKFITYTMGGMSPVLRTGMRGLINEVIDDMGDEAFEDADDLEDHLEEIGRARHEG